MQIKSYLKAILSIKKHNCLPEKKEKNMLKTPKFVTVQVLQYKNSSESFAQHQLVEMCQKRDYNKTAQLI